MECGSVLVRDGALLERTFAIHPDYLDDLGARGDGEVNLADRGLQLSRGFRALKVWMSVQTFGMAAFRSAIQHGLDLAGRHAIRLCVLNPNSTEAGVRSVIAHFGDAPAPRPAGGRPYGTRSRA